MYLLFTSLICHYDEIATETVSDILRIRLNEAVKGKLSWRVCINEENSFGLARDSNFCLRTSNPIVPYTKLWSNNPIVLNFPVLSSPSKLPYDTNNYSLATSSS